jgi:hypothetical protein
MRATSARYAHMPPCEVISLDGTESLPNAQVLLVSVYQNWTLALAEALAVKPSATETMASLMLMV